MTSLEVPVDAEVVEELTFDQAEQFTNEHLIPAAQGFHDAQQLFFDLLVYAYRNDVHVALGFDQSAAGWKQYVEKKVGSVFAGVKGDERKMLVSGFTQVGLSTRAIANVLGVSQNTVVEDRKKSSSERNLSLDAKPPKPPTKGLNGKTYDSDNQKRFTCTECGKQKMMTRHVDIDGELYCEPCAAAYEESMPAAEEPTTHLGNQEEEVDLNKLQQEARSMAMNLPWSKYQVKELRRMITEIASIMNV